MRFFELEKRQSALALFAGALVLAAPLAAPAAPGRGQPESTGPQAVGALVDRYCLTCHNERLRTAGLALDGLDTARPMIYGAILILSVLYLPNGLESLGPRLRARWQRWRGGSAGARGEAT